MLRITMRWRASQTAARLATATAAWLRPAGRKWRPQRRAAIRLLMARSSELEGAPLQLLGAALLACPQPSPAEGGTPVCSLHDGCDQVLYLHAGTRVYMLA